MADGNIIRAIGNRIEIIGDFTSVEVYGVNGTLIYKGKDNVVTVPGAYGRQDTEDRGRIAASRVDIVSWRIARVFRLFYVEHI